MKKLLLLIALSLSVNLSAQKVLYTNAYSFTSYDLETMLVNYGAGYTLDALDNESTDNQKPLVIFDNGTMLGTDVFNSMNDIREFVDNLISARKKGTYTTSLNYTLAKGPYGSVVANIPGRGEMFFSPYLVKQLKKKI